MIGDVKPCQHNDRRSDPPNIADWLIKINWNSFRYVTLRRSAREPNLVLVVDEKAEALAQSVCALDQNQDILAVSTSPFYHLSLFSLL